MAALNQFHPKGVRPSAEDVAYAKALCAEHGQFRAAALVGLHRSTLSAIAGNLTVHVSSLHQLRSSRMSQAA